MNYGEPHILIITHIPAEGEWEAETDWEIEHPDSCPEQLHITGFDIPLHEWMCSVGHEITNVGLEGLSWPADLVPGWVKPEGPDRWGADDWKGLPEGRYVIRAWSSYHEYTREWDGGLELLGIEDRVEVAT